jgi:methyl-accepting chemotaxis protein
MLGRLAGRKEKELELLLREGKCITEGTRQLVSGNLDLTIDPEAYTVLEDLARDISQISMSFRSYIEEITHVLSHLSAGNMAVGFSKEVDYQGDFLPIKNALHKIRHALNASFEEINQLTGEVDHLCSEVDRAYTKIAENTSSQAELLNELSGTIHKITDQTTANAANAEAVSESVQCMKEQTLNGSECMDQMLHSIREVSEASKDISNIIDIISGLAGQTKLLALNASIEAARAGEAGAGFSIVAGEIGSLAQKSAEAVKKTTQLIENSIRTASASTEIAQKTADGFSVIQNSIDRVSGLCDDIATASKEQAENLQSISVIITDISDGVRNNAAYAQENSAVAANMAEVSSKLKKLMTRFRLRSAHGESVTEKPKEQDVINMLSGLKLDVLPKQLYDVTNEKDMDELLGRTIVGLKDVECLYVIGREGYQLSHTILNKELLITQGEDFCPAMPGDYHGGKKYFRKALKRAGQWYTSDEYISAATGGLCRTYSYCYQDKNQKEYVLCIDMISRI